MTIMVEPHLCIPRTNSPRKTSLVMWRVDSYASVTDGV